MRIAYLYPEHLGFMPARVLQMSSTVKALGAEGVETDLLLGRFRGLDRRLNSLELSGALGVKVHPIWMMQRGPGQPLPLNWHGLYHFSCLNRLRGLASAGVEAVYVRHLKLARFLLPRLTELGLPLIYEAHEIFTQTALEEGAGPKKLQSLESLAHEVLSQAQGVVAISRPLQMDLAARGDVKVDIGFAPSGVNEVFFEVDGAERDPSLIAYAGGIFPWKGVDLLIKAMGHLEAGCLEIMGGEAGTDDWQRLTALIKELGLEGRVTLRPRDNQAEVRKLLGRAAIAVWPGTAKQAIAASYTSPLKLFEYLAAGCAVVAPDAPAASSLLSSGQNALLFRPDDPASLAARLQSLLDDPGLVQRLSQEGRELARGYTWRARARRIRGYLEEVL